MSANNCFVIDDLCRVWDLDLETSEGYVVGKKNKNLREALKYALKHIDEVEYGIQSIADEILNENER